MASTFTTSLRLEKQATGENKATWGSKANNDFELLEDAIAGHVNVSIANVDTDLAGSAGVVDTPRNAILTFTGALTADRTVTVPAVTKTYVLRNNTTGGFSIIFKTLGAVGATKQITLRAGQHKYVYFDSALDAFASDDWIVQSSAAQRWGIPAFISGGGIIEAGMYIDFHNTNADAADFSVRLDTQGTTTDLYVTPAIGGARKIWNDTNDGPASGLNADLLDGFHAADIGFPTGTAMLFMQTAAPLGWVKQTTHNNKALRIVSGTVTSGGSVAFTSAFSNQGIAGVVAATVITWGQMPWHGHTASSGYVSSDHQHLVQGQTTSTSAAHAHTVTGTAASAGAHTHTYGTYQGSGIGVAGGAQNPFTSQTTGSAGAHTHTVSGSTDSEPGHSHTVSAVWTGGINANHNHAITVDGAGGNEGHSHSWSGSINLDVQYVDAIICVKS